MHAALAKQERDFPKTTSNAVTGSVISVSMLPLRLSSEKTRIERAGIKNESVTGIIAKKLLISARFARKNGLKNNIPEKIRKREVTM